MHSCGKRQAVRFLSMKWRDLNDLIPECIRRRTMSRFPEKWNLETDVLVIGSGCGGFPAAVSAHDSGAKVMLIEKTDLFGGTTAMGGGGMWIPNNHHNVARGVSDSREKALGYAKLLTQGRAADELIEAYIDTAPEMLKYMEEKVGLRVQVSTMPDYHPEQPGGA